MNKAGGTIVGRSSAVARATTRATVIVRTLTGTICSKHEGNIYGLQDKVVIVIMDYL